MVIDMDCHRAAAADYDIRYVRSSADSTDHCVAVVVAVAVSVAESVAQLWATATVRLRYCR